MKSSKDIIRCFPVCYDYYYMVFIYTSACLFKDIVLYPSLGRSPRRSRCRRRRPAACSPTPGRWSAPWWSPRTWSWEAWRRGRWWEEPWWWCLGGWNNMADEFIVNQRVRSCSSFSLLENSRNPDTVHTKVGLFLFLVIVHPFVVVLYPL